MAYSTINKQTDYFNTKLYTGNGSDNHAITGIGHQPDFVWLKSRSQVKNHFLQDTARGITYQLRSSASNAQNNYASYVKSIQSDGFTLGTDADINNNGSTYVSWNWKAGTTSGLSGGTITPSAYSISATGGFGIYKYTGNSTSGATIAHGLGKVPTMIMVKSLTGTNEWQIYHTKMGNGKWIEFTTGTPQTGTSRWNDTSPTSTLFYLGNDSDVNSSSATYIAYVFCDVTGYSKMGSYTGTGSATQSPFIYTGFKPSWVMIKNISASNDWFMIDNSRDTLSPNNPVGRKSLEANDTAAEVTRTTKDMDFLSNGIKLRTADGTQNNSGEDYIYMAFGQSIVGSNNIAATAR